MRTSVSLSLFACLGLLACGSGDASPAATSGEDSAIPGDSGSSDARETGGGTSCTSARDTAVGPVDKVSTGAVTVIADAAGVKTVYVDATAGGVSGGKTNPWVYVKLASVTRADLTDKQAFTSSDWDLAFKRPVIHTNSGDAGPGKGGAKLVAKPFEAVTAADASTLASETWFDAECTPITDAIGSLRTSFDGWYDYDSATMKVSPKDVTWIVAAANGDLYKLRIASYYGTATGGSGTAGANYVLELAALK
jgi:hypothetical protein